jgi:hypothetical protein
MDCPIPQKPSSNELKVIRDTIPLKELISEFKIASRSQFGGGFSKKQRAMAHVLSVITSLLIGGIGAAAIYYSLYYSGLLQYLWPAFDAAEKAFQGCGSIAGTTGRWALGKLTMGYVPDCNEIHRHFDEMLERFYSVVTGSNITLVYLSGGYGALVDYYLDLLFGAAGSQSLASRTSQTSQSQICDIAVSKKMFSRSLSKSKSSRYSSPAAGGGNRRRIRRRRL